MLNAKGKNNENGDFDWRNAVYDAGIIGGLTFFSTLAATSAVGVPTLQACIASAIAGAGQFFVTLAVKRGLRELPQ